MNKKAIKNILNIFNYFILKGGKAQVLQHKGFDIEIGTAQRELIPNLI